MDIKLVRLIVGIKVYYIDNGVDHHILYRRLVYNSIGIPTIYKLTNNYHLGIL